MKISIGKKISNYIKNTGKKICQSSLVRFGVKSRAQLKSDSLELTKKKYNSQAEKLKDFYESKGVPYLLPNQEWSDKKVIDTVNLLGKKLDVLSETKNLTKQAVQEAIDSLAPEAGGKILIKDFADMELDLRAKKYSKDEITKYLTNYQALAATNNKETTLYINFGAEGKAQIGLKQSLEHEFKHALTARAQNTKLTDIYKNDSYKCTNQNGTFNRIFSDFELSFRPNAFYTKKEATLNSMLASRGFKSTEDMDQQFEKKVRTLVRDASFYRELELPPTKNAWKQFFNYLKNKAKDEKEAHASNIRLREYSGDLNSPTIAETSPLFYEAVEKFFEKKRIQVNNSTLEQRTM